MSPTPETTLPRLAPDSPAAEGAASRPPLAGVRVLDLTRLLPGPVCTLHLADLGADVIKIEDTGAGDYAAPALRRLVHRNKRALRIDLKRPEGVAVLHRLAREADVLVEGFRPGVTERLGIGYAALAALNPRLVYVSITGYGQTGPDRDEPGHDLNYAARCGVAEQVGRAGEPPALSNLPMADLMGGALVGAMGLLAALFDAVRTGRGRHVDIAMADGLLAHALLPMVALTTGGAVRPAGTDKLTGALPCYGHYRTADGRYLAVGALEAKFWHRFCELVGREDLKPLGHPADPAAAEAARAAVAALVGAEPLAHWQRLFERAGACASPVQRLDEALADPQFVARGMVLHDDEGPLLGCPVQMSGFRFALRRPAPAAGADSDAVLAEAGYDAAERAALREAGAVA